MNRDNPEQHSTSLGMNDPARTQNEEFKKNIKQPKNIVTLYSQDFVHEDLWEQICDQVGLDFSKVDKLDLHLSAYEVNK